jgi:hypothetical protein
VAAITDDAVKVIEEVVADKGTLIDAAIVPI